jgi:hypothetical protein
MVDSKNHEPKVKLGIRPGEENFSGFSNWGKAMDAALATSLK